MQRRHFLALTGAAFALPALPLHAANLTPSDTLLTWYKLVIELVRHTATYSPPVAARAFGYLGVAAYESLASGTGATSLAGQINGLTALPAREAGTYDEALVLHAVLSETVAAFFGNTGPTGQRSMAAMRDKLGMKLRGGVAEDVAARSAAYGLAVAKHIEDYSKSDGGHDVKNMGFPMEWTLQKGPEFWVPTSVIVQQQAPLLPNWGKNRPFAMPVDAPCTAGDPPAYSEDPTSEFYKEAMEVYEVSKTLTDDQKAIARFWSDDPMLSPTPPGHWISITLQTLHRDGTDALHAADALARVGMVVSDAFVACWADKIHYNRLRPVTYIKRVIDKAWEPMLITPPFAEYPSGHSTQSGAAAVVLTAVFGENFAFDDATHADDGIKPRHFPNFDAAAAEAAASRLYGGIHFRAANENGLRQGAEVGSFINTLKTLA
ncbi:vanadium-dependent haloperoxidase [Cypionkella sp.]|uniref:vanadium-dependent haloperoxidase n=1 Tax=Cypionkella sp. TaxID=2811411 RepID=UPI002AB8D943|nr:vanadium-dependent haloperoxidase [Cypionkella sp.]MDZ4392307.1 vanadium-dependent haloperoxidase [Cypionkella sp.]